MDRFFCSFFRVNHPWEINPYGTCQFGWRLAQEVVLTVDTQGEFVCQQGQEGEPQKVSISLERSKWHGSGQPRSPFCHPSSGEPMAVSLDEVAIYDIKSRFKRSSHDIPWAVRINYEHAAMAHVQGTEEMDEIFKETGAVHRAYTIISKTEPSGEELEMATPLRALSFSYLNPEFVRTTFLLNERNILNGIIRIPREVCIEAGLPVYNGPPQPDEGFILKQLENMQLGSSREEVVQNFQKEWHDTYVTPDMRPIDHYVAIPIDHLIAWGLHSKDYAEERGYKCHYYSYVREEGQEPVVLYFVIANVLFDQMLKDTLSFCLNKVDKRPLHQVAFELVPMTRPSAPEPSVHRGEIMLRSTITYAASPKLSQKTIDGLAITLCPGFPTSHYWSMDQMTRQLNIEHQMKMMKDRKRVERMKK